MVHPHNEPIELMAEYGLIGVGLFLGAIVSLCIALIRLIKTSPRLYHVLPAVALLAALAGTFVHGFFDFELRIFPNALMLAVLAGTVVAPVLRQSAERRAQSDASWGGIPHRLTSVLRPLFSVSILLAACWAIQVMSAEALRVRGDSLRLEKERSRAETLYKASLAIDPQNWKAHLGLGQVYSYYRYHELDPAKKMEWALLERDTFEKAARHNSKKEEVTYGLGRAQLACGDREAALDTLRRAAAYKRFNDFYWRKLGIELRKAGHYEEALETFLYARKLHRGNPTVNRNIQWLTDRLKGGRVKGLKGEP
jgi:tetratricopeptide (TPR) repeat protein